MASTKAAAKKGGSRKKVLIELEPEPDAPEVEQYENEPEDVPVVEDHTITQRYRVIKPLEDLKPPPPTVEPAAATPPTVEEAESDALIKLFRSTTGDPQDMVIRVMKLLDATTRMRAGNYIYCGKIALTENYLDDIQQQFGGGHYRLNLYRNGTMVHGQYVTIAQMNRREGTMGLNGAALPQIAPTLGAPAQDAPARENPLTGIRQTLQAYKEMRELFEPARVSMKAENPEEMSLTTAIVRVIESDEGQVDKIKRRLFRDDSGTDWERIVDKGLGMLPIVMQGIQAIFARPGAQPAQPAPQAIAAQSLLTPGLQQFYLTMLEAMADHRDPHATAAELAAYRGDMQVRATLDHLTQEDTATIFAELAKLEVYVPAMTPKHKGAIFLPHSAEWLDAVLQRISDMLFPEPGAGVGAEQTAEAADATAN
jgi:hypothetical protein